MKLFRILILLLASPGLGAAMTAAEQEAYFTVGGSAVTVTRTVGGGVPLSVTPAATETKALGGAALVAAGLKAWSVFADGAPSSEAATSYFSALPPGLYNNWTAVDTWIGPVEHTYDYRVTNLMGIEVIRARYKISYYYAGTEAPGSQVRGKYLANFTVTPVEVHVIWGWRFNLETQLADPMNVGSVREPVARLQADLKWRVSTMLSPRGDTGYWSYVLDGAGNYTDLQRTQRDLTGNVRIPDAPPPPGVIWN